MRTRSLTGTIGLLCAATLLLAQAWLMWRLELDPVKFAPKSLSSFPVTIGEWKGRQATAPDFSTESDGHEMLYREYRNPNEEIEIDLKIVYYPTQVHVDQQYDLEEFRPDGGWSQLVATTVPLRVEQGNAARVRYDLVALGEGRCIVLRWLQTRQRILSSGETLHLERILNALARRPSDLASVEIIVNPHEDQTERAAQAAVEFAQQVATFLPATLFRP